MKKLVTTEAQRKSDFLRCALTERSNQVGANQPATADDGRALTMRQDHQPAYPQIATLACGRGGR